MCRNTVAHSSMNNPVLVGGSRGFSAAHLCFVRRPGPRWHCGSGPAGAPSSHSSSGLPQSDIFGGAPSLLQPVCCRYPYNVMGAAALVRSAGIPHIRAEVKVSQVADSRVGEKRNTQGLLLSALLPALHSSIHQPHC